MLGVVAILYTLNSVNSSGQDVVLSESSLLGESNKNMTIKAGEASQKGTPFIWGTATAAYQVEGYRNVSGRQPSIWDCFDTPMTEANDVRCDSIKSVKPSGKRNTWHGLNAAKTDEEYKRYAETASTLYDHGFNAYRMSISWSRVITYHSDPDGKIVGVPNLAGIAHYKDVIKSQTDLGISVVLTMFHWDLPQFLENWAANEEKCTPAGSATGSFWLCPDSNLVFREYAELLLKEFGSEVKYWVTLNEPLTVIEDGYAGGKHAPGRCSNRTQCWAGDSAVEPYIATHNLLRAHAEGFNAWKKSTNKLADSDCAMVLSGSWGVPADPDSAEDIAAAQRFMEWQMAIFADPIWYGRWPDSVVEATKKGSPYGEGTANQTSTGSSLPPLDPMIVGTHTKIYFMNHYTSGYVWGNHGEKDTVEDGAVVTTKADAHKIHEAQRDMGFYAPAKFSTSGKHPKTNKPIGRQSKASKWLYEFGPGIASIQNWLHARYPDVALLVTENGWGDSSASKTSAVNDLDRCNFYRGYIGNMSKNAVENNITVVGYFAWSIMDNYEWSDSFNSRFGLVYVDYETQERTPKLSMQWFKSVTSMTQLPANGWHDLPSCEDLEYPAVQSVASRHMQKNQSLSIEPPP